jgi:hypothetical protein
VCTENSILVACLTSATMVALVCLILRLLASPFKSNSRLEAENAAPASADRAAAQGARSRPVYEQRSSVLPPAVSLVSVPLSVLKIRFYSNGDEVRRGPTQMRCGLRTGWRDGSERLCQETDESSTRYNKRHTSSGSRVSALRPRRQYGRHTRVGSIRSVFRRSRSAKASLGQSACRGCPWPVIGW